MNREQRERQVDGALARALGPEQVEPREGFEGRLLANLATQPEQMPWWRWMWAPALAAAAVIAIVIGIQTSRRSAPRVVATNPITPVATQAPKALPPVSPAVTKRVASGAALGAARAPHRNSGGRHRTVLAKAETAEPSKPFPAAPLTESERALLAMLRQNPDEAGLLSDRQQQRNKEAAQYMEQAFRNGNQ